MIVDKELLDNVFRAYFDARRNKRNTVNQLKFEIDLESNLVELATQIQNRTYKVGRSVCFIVNVPVKREIFAADFRDRVVHHLLFNYINPLFEHQFIYDCYSCRKGYGTSAGINRMDHFLRSISVNYTRRAYVLKLDLQGYFMSINRDILYNRIESTLKSRKNRKDKNLDLELYLLREIIFNDSVEGCQMNGSPHDWDDLPKSKSLFYAPANRGLPIGNLTSQLFSNIYLTDFDNYIKRTLKIRYYGRYVDDFFIMYRSKGALINTLAVISKYLHDNYELTVHPNKTYLQEVDKGVAFLGAYLKPHRRYITRRVKSSILKRAFEWQKCDTKVSEEMIELQLATLNSYFGYTAQFKTYKFRKKIWTLCNKNDLYFICNDSISKVKPSYSEQKLCAN
jgi:retron-type reverse transcriptase